VTEIGIAIVVAVVAAGIVGVVSRFVFPLSVRLQIGRLLRWMATEIHADAKTPFNAEGVQLAADLGKIGVSRIARRGDGALPVESLLAGAQRSIQQLGYAPTLFDRSDGTITSKISDIQPRVEVEVILPDPSNGELMNQLNQLDKGNAFASSLVTTLERLKTVWVDALDKRRFRIWFTPYMPMFSATVADDIAHIQIIAPGWSTEERILLRVERREGGGLLEQYERAIGAYRDMDGASEIVSEDQFNCAIRLLDERT